MAERRLDAATGPCAPDGGWNGSRLTVQPLRRPIPAELAIGAITMVWGTTFLIVHAAMQWSGPLFFVGARMSCAGLLSLLLFRRTLSGLRRRELLAGACIGFTIFAGYGLQAEGLRQLDGTTSAFITALYVPLVPLLQWLVFRRPPALPAWLGILLAFLGLLLLTAPQRVGSVWAPGAAVTVLATLAIAAEILLISHFAEGVDSYRVTVVQLLVAGGLSLLAMPLTGERVPPFRRSLMLTVLGLALASAVIQWTMNWAQKSVSPTRATVLYAAEPVWAALFGRVLGERLPLSALAGGALIVTGVVVSGRKPRA